MDQWPSSYGSLSALNLAVLCLTLRTYFICESNELYKYQSKVKLPTPWLKTYWSFSQIKGIFLRGGSQKIGNKCTEAWGVALPHACCGPQTN